MLRAIRLLLALSLTALVACGGPAAEPEPASADPVTSMTREVAPTEARLEDGVQVVEITVGPTGYDPAAVSVEAGVPARLVFTRTIEGECASAVQFPDFGISPTTLPLNEPTAIEITPDSPGTFTFVCGMDMLRGTVVVRS